jgi:hypothetical protein
MSKWRKKPIVIEATQWFKDGDHSAVQGPFNFQTGESPKFFISTLEGPMRVTHGDWIITGIDGEVYPCKPDIFEATYEPA